MKKPDSAVFCGHRFAPANEDMAGCARWMDQTLTLYVAYGQGGERWLSRPR